MFEKVKKCIHFAMLLSSHAKFYLFKPFLYYFYVNAWK